VDARITPPNDHETELVVLHGLTPHHLAFSSYAFNYRNELPVTQRAMTKLTWHPRPSKTLHDAATHRLEEEFALQSEAWLVLSAFTYRAEGNGIVELELSPVFLCRVSGQPNPDPVGDFAWWPWDRFCRAADGVNSPISVVLGESLPASAITAFAAEESERPGGQCFVLVTVDPDKLARPCMLSIGEVLAIDARRLRIIVWRDSRTTANLDRGDPILLVIAAPPDAFHIHAVPKRLKPRRGARWPCSSCSVEVDGHDGMPLIWSSGSTPTFSRRT
jgi:isopentenyl-diphosphate Delta-isomerase